MSVRPRSGSTSITVSWGFVAKVVGFLAFLVGLKYGVEKFGIGPVIAMLGISAVIALMFWQLSKMLHNEGNGKPRGRNKSRMFSGMRR